jgi:D-sedoheptulose 7-phosphate isomerase
MEAEQRIARHFQQSIDTKRQTLSSAATAIMRAGRRLADRLDQGGKILICGNGGSAADAQHFASELTNRFEIKRRGLPAIALTTDSSALTSIANDYAFDQVFARQIHALGSAGDLLVAISTSGNSANIVQAVNAAQARAMAVVTLTGRDGGELSGILAEDDVEVRVPATSTARIQEVHILIIHCWCDLIDHHFSGQET